MNYAALTLEELGRMCTADAGARQYFADNAEQIINDLTEPDGEGYDPAGCFDDGHRIGTDERNTELRDIYLDDIRTWLDLVPDMAVAGDHDLDDLETLLQALHEELADKTAPAIDLNADSLTNIKPKAK